jgi:hypothetical protein
MIKWADRNELCSKFNTFYIVGFAFTNVVRSIFSKSNAKYFPRLVKEWGLWDDGNLMTNKSRASYDLKKTDDALGRWRACVWDLPDFWPRPLASWPLGLGQDLKIWNVPFTGPFPIQSVVAGPQNLAEFLSFPHFFLSENSQIWLIPHVDDCKRRKSTPLPSRSAKKKRKEKNTVLIISCVLGRPITWKENNWDLKKCTI